MCQLVAVSPQYHLSLREAAAETLRHGEALGVRDTLWTLLGPSQPVQLQVAAIDSAMAMRLKSHLN